MGERISVSCDSMFGFADPILEVGVLIFSPLVSAALTIFGLFPSLKQLPQPPKAS
jgi:hypothetical protein